MPIDSIGFPVRYNQRGSAVGLNCLYFAHKLASDLRLRYFIEKKHFFQYDTESGVWNQVSKMKLQQMILERLHVIDVGENIEGFITNNTAKSILELLMGIAESDVSVKENVFFFHAADTMIEYDDEVKEWQLKDFDPEYGSYVRSVIKYNPNAGAPEKFLSQLLQPAMTEDDIEVLQLYLGQCLLGKNLSQTFLLLEGTPGGGKSTLVNIIEKVIGKHHCAELRASLTTGRFEMGGLVGKRLLTGKDVSSEYMNNAGARALKVLTGNDSVTAEYKNSNKRFTFDGCFNIIITSNNTIKIKFDGDLEAWRRRILIIKYDNKPPEKKIANFDDKLIVEEGSAILNWIMDGAIKLLRNGSAITKTSEQKRKVNRFLQSSDPFTHYAKRYIHRTLGAAVTTAEVVAEFFRFCNAKGWDPLPEREVQKQLKVFMAKEFGASVTHGIKRNGKDKRGYRHFQIREKNKG